MYPKLFGEFYDYMDGLKQNEMPASERGPYLHPFKITYASDLKAIWTTSGRGGNCKNTTLSFVIFAPQNVDANAITMTSAIQHGGSIVGGLREIFDGLC